VNNRVEADHGRLKARLRPTRGLKAPPVRADPDRRARARAEHPLRRSRQVARIHHGPVRQVFLEMITAVHCQAPATVPAWLTAACAGLAARHPDDPPGHARSLVEAVAACVHADDDLRDRLIRAAGPSLAGEGWYYRAG
jgi:hypothetical protein